MSSEPTHVRTDPVRFTLRLFSHLFEEGLTPALKVRLLQLPEFHDVVSRQSPLDQEAEYQTVLGFNVFPLGNFYLKTTSDTLLSHVDLLRTCYEESGLNVSESEAIDHISSELTFLARCRDDSLRARLIDGHLMGWLPVFTNALRTHGNPLFQRLSELTLLLVLELRSLS